MGDLEFCQNESEEVDETFSTLFVTLLLPQKSFLKQLKRCGGVHNFLKKYYISVQSDTLVQLLYPWKSVEKIILQPFLNVNLVYKSF